LRRDRLGSTVAGVVDQRGRPDDEERWERIRRNAALLGLPIAPWVSPRDRERWRRDNRMLRERRRQEWRAWSRGERVMAVVAWIVMAVLVLGLFVLFATGRGHLAALIIVGVIVAWALWTPIAIVLMVRRDRRRRAALNEIQ
jgi:hypothetical protein